MLINPLSPFNSLTVFELIIDCNGPICRLPNVTKIVQVIVTYSILIAKTVLEIIDFKDLVVVCCFSMADIKSNLVYLRN